MNINYLTTDKRSSTNDIDIKICQSCGENYVVKRHNDGADEIIEGHNSARCEEIENSVYSFQPGAFGIVIPDNKSEIIWQFQTNGLICSQRYFRGHYIPLNTPSEFKKNLDSRDIPFPDVDNQLVDLISQLVRLNYDIETTYNEEETGKYIKKRNKLWTLIDDRLPFTYEDVNAPHGYTENEEGIKWIKILSNQDNTMNSTSLKPLINSKVVLIYPNCD